MAEISINRFFWHKSRFFPLAPDTVHKGMTTRVQVVHTHLHDLAEPLPALKRPPGRSNARSLEEGIGGRDGGGGGLPTRLRTCAGRYFRDVQTGLWFVVVYSEIVYVARAKPLRKSTTTR